VRGAVAIIEIGDTCAPGVKRGSARVMGGTCRARVNRTCTRPLRAADLTYWPAYLATIQ